MTIRDIKALQKVLEQILETDGHCLTYQEGGAFNKNAVRDVIKVLDDLVVSPHIVLKEP